MNKNIEPGKTLWYLRDGMGYLWLALIKRKKTFRRLVVASGRRGERGFQVYPRACGGTRSVMGRSNRALGLSPRVRGNLNPDRHIALDLGSIPACAGEPPSRTQRYQCGKVIALDLGSIPARAGKPRTRSLYAGRGRVYPRACGGTGNNRLPVAQGQGLSPRVRGNQARPKPGALSSGSIPARAGKPLGTPRRNRRCRVYPRACGETKNSLVSSGRSWGLSPRVRGNLARHVLALFDPGSIPARAGKPLHLPGARASA